MLKHALELNPDGKYRFRTVVLLVGRQNGKSTLLQVWALWRMYVDRAPLVIGTAQNLDLAEEQWSAAVALAEDNEELAAEIVDVKRTNGKFSLKIENFDLEGVKQTQRYKVAAANRKGGRGLSGDLVIMDELREHSNWDSWGAVTKTTMARPRPQVVCASNAGDASSVVLSHLRKQALTALEEGRQDVALGLFEWSAMYWKEATTTEPGQWANLKTGDRKGWAMANPSLNHADPNDPEAGGITTAALEAAYGTDPDPVFRTECLCQWVHTTRGGAFEDGLWDKGRDVNSARATPGRYVMGLDLSWDRNGSIAMAGRREDGKVHGEVIAARTGTDWIIPWFLAPPESGLFERRIDDPELVGVALQANGAPVSALVTAMVEAGIPVIEWSGGELGRGTGQFYDTVRGGGLCHRGHPILDVAVAMAATRPIADYWVWDRKKSLVDIAPLIALTAAVWALDRPVEEEAESAYSDPDLMFV
jgi:phage terminase large subunit-like protein